MLTTEQIARVIEESAGRRPDSIDTTESKAFRAKIDRERDAIEAHGGVMDVPSEWPSI